MTHQDPRARTEQLAQPKTPEYNQPKPPPYTDGNGARLAELAVADNLEGWRSRTRVVLTPIAAPSIMGLFGFMIATLMLGAWQAGWYGTPNTPLIIWPFALIAGGVLQSIAAVASFRARDGVAVAVHTAWGAFWIAWGIMEGLVAAGIAKPIPLGVPSSSFAFWFIALALVTGIAALGSLAQSFALFTVLSTLTVGAGFTAAGFYGGALWAERVGGWLFVISAAAAWLTAGAMVLEHSFGRTIIPLGKWSADANIPGRKPTTPLAFSGGMPGVRFGQ